MSRNAIAAMAVIFVSGFAGCAATARATEIPAASTKAVSVPAHAAHAAPLHVTDDAVATVDTKAAPIRTHRTP